MNQLFSIKKDLNNSNALWWKPLFSLQRELNHKIREAFSPFELPSFLAPSVLDAEEEIFSYMQNNTHRVFSELFNNRQMLTPWCTGAGTEPYVDIIENDDCFKLRADIPGFKAKDIEISVADCAIIIKGEKQEEKQCEGDNYIRRECHSGSFSRTIALPEEANLEGAEASFEDNVLKIEIPKKAKARQKARKLKIEAENENLPAISLKFSPANSEGKNKDEKPSAGQGDSSKDKKSKVA